ncbi:hypothetical protein KJ678_00875 [Patescibacteria group bacterium]|nr:hypothetical protein [Patescibacteria group bacterium]
MNDIGTIICLLLSSLLLLTFGFLSAFFTKKFNEFVEKRAGKVLNKKIKLPHLQKIKVKEELKILKILGGLMFFFGVVFMGIFVMYARYFPY